MVFTDFESAERKADLLGVQRPEYLKQIIAVPVRVSEVSDIIVVKYNNRQQNSLSHVVVRDRMGIEMTVVGVVGDARVDVVMSAVIEAAELELFAQVELDGKGRYILVYLAAHRIGSCRQLIGATHAEVREAKTLVEQKGSDPESIITYVREEIVDILGIKGMDSFPILQKAVDAVILQAASHGRVNGTPAKLQLLLVGPPATGKGVILQGASIVSPIIERVSTTRVTPAGLVGYSRRYDGNKTKIIPGQLALASWGTALVEDLQHIDTHTHRHFYGILCDMMELGRLIRSTHQGVNIPVDTGFLGDINPKSSIRPGYSKKEVLFLEDLGIPVNVLSRLDLVLIFPRDVARQIETMLHIVASIKKIGPESEARQDPRARRLRVLVSHLRDRFPTIHVEPVAGLVQDKLSELLDLNAEKLQALSLAGDFMLRGAKSVMKLVAASARLHARGEANETDVQVAFGLFQEKIAFLTRIESSLEAISKWKGSLGARALRRQRLVQHFGGREATVEQMKPVFPGVTRRTLIRDLHDVGARHLGEGRWLVPPAADAGTAA